MVDQRTKRQVTQRHLDAMVKKEIQAEPVCPRCGGTGRDDSGGTYEWGETIYVRCECQEEMPPE